ncbi:MAG: hypothetical protein QN181_08225 [Armatimonadota bacterium]|nr:hypothetical protein [Armatimonadota bacterium]MDR7563655.1 hypothetical protein [Armatimonadota bacterium]MDR7567457.1 hypothetical protein [Armatimonadota bacterium]
MRCPQCGGTLQTFISGRFVRSRGGWVWVRSVRRACAGCGMEWPEQDLSLRCTPVREFTESLRGLQRSGDLIVVRYPDGTLEVVS